MTEIEGKLRDESKVEQLKTIRRFWLVVRPLLTLYLLISVARGLAENWGWFEHSVFFNWGTFLIALILFIVSFGYADMVFCPNCGSRKLKDEFGDRDVTEVSHLNYDADGKKIGHTERIVRTETTYFRRCKECNHFF